MSRARPPAQRGYPVQTGITARDGLRALGAGVGLLVLLAGVPALLLLTIGNPVPGWQDLIAGDVSDSAVISVLATIAWLAWAQFALAVGVETVSLLARAPMPRRIPGVTAGQQQLARALVTAILVLIPALSPVAGAMAATNADAATLPSSSPVATASATAGPQVAARPADARAATAARSSSATALPGGRVAEAAIAPSTHEVTIHSHGPGTYWDLAEQHLGDGSRWKEIWHLNEGRDQADGSRMTSPGLLRPGWTVLLPASVPPSASPIGVDTAGQVTVHRGDTLSEIAEDHDADWHQVFESNEGRLMPGGKHFTDADHIEPGWSIDVSDPSAHAAPDRPASWDGAGADQGGSRGAGQAGVDAVHSATAGLPALDPAAVPAAAGTTSGQGQDAGHDAASGQLEPAQTKPQESSVFSAVSLGAGANLLAAAALVALWRYRRRQFRHRLPGQMIAAVPPDLAAMEKALLTQGGANLRDVVWLDEALRDLAQRVTSAGGRLPDITAVRMDDEVVELVMGPADLHAASRPGQPGQNFGALPPAPWVQHPVSGRWQLRREDHRVGAQSQAAQRQLFAPFPTLVSIGYSDEGDYWLLDLEKVGSLALTGDRERCLDLGRFIAAELAHNLWSEQLQVTMAGFGAELRDVHPDRIVYTRDGSHAVARLSAQLRSNVAVMQRTGVADALAGREQNVAGDQWMPQVLLIDPAQAGSGQELDDLLLALRHRPGRSAATVVVSGGTASPARAGWADSADTAPSGIPLLSAGAAPGTPRAVTEWELIVGADGFVQVPALGLRLHAQQLGAVQASQLAQLLSSATSLGGTGIPAAHGDDPWDELSDASGAPIAGLTVPRPDPSIPAGFSIRLAPPVIDPVQVPAPVQVLPQPVQPQPQSPVQRPLPVDPQPQFEPQAPVQQAPIQQPPTVQPQPPGHSQSPVQSQPQPAVQPAVQSPASVSPSPAPSADPASIPTSTVLPRPLAAMLATTASTGRDIATLAPGVTERVRRQVEQADAGLDDDLLVWQSAQTARPRLSLLGPLQVRTPGELPADRPRVAWHTEVVAYFAAHPRGVTAEQLGTDLWPDDPDIASKSKLRQAVYLVRRWLGDDPATGEPFLPAASPGPSGGAALYRMEGLLCDADLFRRLRLRGVARGVDGIQDLEAALDLVTGPPFDQRRPGGYAWLVDTPLDHEYTGMIVDVAHLVATHHLAEGRPGQAAVAARISLSAGSRDDIALLDLVAACDAQGNHGEAAAWIQQILANHDADVEEDLPPRTAEVLHRRRWMEAAS